MAVLKRSTSFIHILIFLIISLSVNCWHPTDLSEFFNYQIDNEIQDSLLDLRPLLRPERQADKQQLNPTLSKSKDTNDTKKSDDKQSANVTAEVSTVIQAEIVNIDNGTSPADAVTKNVYPTTPPPKPTTPKSRDVFDPDTGSDELETPDGFNRTSFEFNQTTVDHHRYYKSVTYSGEGNAQPFWVDFESIKEKVITNPMLSDSHRRAATVQLTFSFPFYGHPIRNVTIATGGFLFTGQFVHTWLAATQYIAPLMANFDTSASKDASVKYTDNGTAFTVLWDKVILKDHQDAGSFTFQVTLHKSGDIVFAYKEVPLFATLIEDQSHPVKVGLSDAYIVDRTIFYVRRKTIYEYHKIDMKKDSSIGNWTAIVFKAMPTCVSLPNCMQCLSQEIGFTCQWCNKIGKCSNGLDRHRQEWLQTNCELVNTMDPSECSSLAPPPTPPPDEWEDDDDDDSPPKGAKDSSVDPYQPGSHVNGSMTFANATELPSSNSSIAIHDVNATVVYDDPTISQNATDILGGADSARVAHVSAGTVVGVVFLVSFLMSIFGWVMYAYFFPHTASGQFLIRYRPSTWSFGRGEARYTAAAIHSIHM